jgi:hypothetical protein
MEDLISVADEFSPEELSIALVATSLCVQRSPHSVPPLVTDLVFRLLDPFSVLFGLPVRRSSEVLKAATSRLEALTAELLTAVYSFTIADCLVAKAASVEVVKKARQLKRLALVGERPILNEIDFLLGTTFRKFCESCERNDINSLLEKAPALDRLAHQCISPSEPRMKQRINSTLWHSAVAPLARHMVELVDRESRRSEISTTPLLKLASNVFKLDLTRCDRETSFSCRIVNSGQGKASKVVVELGNTGIPAELKILDPSGPFEIGGESEQIIIFGLTLKEPRDFLSLPLTWRCSTLTGRDHINTDTLVIEQQHMQTDWDILLENPPYTLTDHCISSLT